MQSPAFAPGFVFSAQVREVKSYAPSYRLVPCCHYHVASSCCLCWAQNGRCVMRYELYYWPDLQGRGEFIRLALEEAGAPYVDVARKSKRGMAAMMKILQGRRGKGP